MDPIKIQKAENVLMLDKYGVNNILGNFYLTETHFIFMDPSGKKKIWVLNTHVGNVEKLPLTTTGSPLQIRCKNFLNITFVIPKERDCHEIYLTLLRLSSPTRDEDIYCFNYKGGSENIPQSVGWNFFNIQEEFQRQGAPNEEWSLTRLNANYELCETYPRYLYVPNLCTNNILMGSAKFRSKGRLPVLTYLHTNKASICRCSQPLSGFKARCLKDEQMLYYVLCTNPNAKYLYVVDTRPRINAMANRAAGKGYENENFYDNIKFQFFGIENIHVMRTSLNKLMELQKTTSMSAFLSGLESSGWLKHIRAILETSWFIARKVSKGISVVVHCSDGWDRTAQVCSLASLLLDPFYRTIHGFQVLIEKDWLAFGHKFSDRYGFINADSKELAPIFTQFLDATYQLLHQYPYMFQFNEQYLITLHDHVQSCQYGNFVGNCEKDRHTLRLSERTWSLWGYMAKHINEFINPLYSCSRFREASSAIIEPKLHPQSIELWRGLYFKFENGVHPRESYEDFLLTIFNHTSSIEDHIKFLAKRINFISQLGTPQNSEKGTMDKYKLDIESLRECLLKNVTKETVGEQEGISSKHEINQLSKQLDAVSLDWKPSRSMDECKCQTTFDAFNLKLHCWSCGNVMCQRCMGIYSVLEGYATQRAVPTCKFCTKSSSTESPTTP